MGINIKPEFPKNSSILLKNNLKQDINLLAKDLVNKIKKIV